MGEVSQAVDDTDFVREMIARLEKELDSIKSSDLAARESMRREITKLKVSLARLETRIGLWAAGGGGGAVGVAELLRFLV